jgi:hypothetical protein
MTTPYHVQLSVGAPLMIRQQHTGSSPDSTASSSVCRSFRSRGRPETATSTLASSGSSHTAPPRRLRPTTASASDGSLHHHITVVEREVHCRWHDANLPSRKFCPGDQALQSVELRGGPHGSVAHVRTDAQSRPPSSVGVAAAVLPQGHGAASRRRRRRLIRSRLIVVIQPYRRRHSCFQAKAIDGVGGPKQSGLQLRFLPLTTANVRHPAVVASVPSVSKAQGKGRRNHCL